MNSNITKALDEVISLDAWYASFDSEGRASVHVDLSFFVGEMGSEDASEVTFKLSLRRAILKIIIPNTEGVSVMQSSVDREPTLEGVKKVIEESQISKTGSAGINAQLRAPIGVTAEGKIQASKAVSRTASTEFVTQITEFDIKQVIDSGRNYGWDIRTSSGSGLVGKVWDPVKRPRLSIKKMTESKIEPSFQVCVYCRKGDLIVEDVKLKNSNLIINAMSKNRMAAAKAYIKSRLIEDGLLNTENDGDMFEIKIADSTVVPEIK